MKKIQKLEPTNQIVDFFGITSKHDQKLLLEIEKTLKGYFLKTSPKGIETSIEEKDQMFKISYTISDFPEVINCSSILDFYQELSDLKISIHKWEYESGSSLLLRAQIYKSIDLFTIYICIESMFAYFYQDKIPRQRKNNTVILYFD
jgi:hypothetical protein